MRSYWLSTISRSLYLPGAMDPTLSYIPMLFAGFLVAVAGDIMRMPGLSRSPNAERMSIKDGVVKGLF